MADVQLQSLVVAVDEVVVSGSNLFRVAAAKLGDATQWDRIAALNGIVDPWIGPATSVRIPGAGPGNGGILT